MRSRLPKDCPDVAATFERLINDLNRSSRELELYDLEYFDRGTFVRFDDNGVTSSMVGYLYEQLMADLTLP